MRRKECTRIYSSNGRQTMFSIGTIQALQFYFNITFLLLLSPSFVRARSPPVDLGTTLVAIKYKDGVVVGADTRTSVSATYVSHRYANKIVPITDWCVLCRSGSSADTQAIAQAVIDYNLERFHKYDGTSHLSPSQVANWLRYQMIYGGGSGAISLLIAGFDINTNSPVIYSIAPSGALLTEDDFAVAGSGSTYIVGHLDDYFSKHRRYIDNQRKKQRQDNEINQSFREIADSTLLEEGDAIELCHRVVQMAINRDGSSGGVIRLCIINLDGTRHITILPPSSTSSTKTTVSLPGFADPI
jgi:20S proteasome subunit beta 1